MIQRLSHVTVWVDDQDAAYDFYVNKLGLEVRTDATMENGFRWLTVGPQSQPGFEIVLMKIAPGPHLDEAAAATLRELLGKGALGGGVFETADEREVESVGRFNRFYTRQIGVLDEGMLASPYSLAEVRVLYELAHRERPTATEVGRALGLDAGYLSRILRGFQQRGLIDST